MSDYSDVGKHIRADVLAVLHEHQPCTMHEIKTLCEQRRKDYGWKPIPDWYKHPYTKAIYNLTERGDIQRTRDDEHTYVLTKRRAMVMDQVATL